MNAHLHAGLQPSVHLVDNPLEIAFAKQDLEDSKLFNDWSCISVDVSPKEELLIPDCIFLMGPFEILS